MIRFTADSLQLSQGVCKALLSFASKDSNRVAICGIGINQGDPCATDGHSAIRFLVPTLPRDGIIAKNSPVQGRTFTREYVELKLRIAKAEKNDTVVLRFESLSDYRFPPLDQVEKTEQRTDLDLARGIEAQFLDRFMGVCEACRATDRAKKDLPFVRFSYLGDPNEPMTFVVDDTTRGGNYARVTIMPVQL